MAASFTVTLDGTYRPNSAFTVSGLTAANLTGSCTMLLNSGAVLLAPTSTAALTLWHLSCMGAVGTGKGKGMVAVDQRGKQHGSVKLLAASTLTLGMVSVERALSTAAAAGTLTLASGTAVTVTSTNKVTGGATQGTAPS